MGKRYDENGRFLHVEHVDDPVEVVAANAARDVALHAGIPIDQFPQDMPNGDWSKILRRARSS